MATRPNRYKGNNLAPPDRQPDGLGPSRARRDAAHTSRSWHWWQRRAPEAGPLAAPPSNPAGVATTAHNDEAATPPMSTYSAFGSHRPSGARHCERPIRRANTPHRPCAGDGWSGLGLVQAPRQLAVQLPDRGELLVTLGQLNLKVALLFMESSEALLGDGVEVLSKT